MSLRPMTAAAMAATLTTMVCALLAASAARAADELPDLPPGTSQVFTVLESCKDASGRFQPATVLESSGHSDVDKRALRLSRARAYRPAPADEVDGRGCVRFRINFLVDERGRIVEPKRPAGTRAIDPSSHADLPPNARE